MKHGIAIEGSAPLSLDNEVSNDLPGVTIDCTIIEGDRWGSSGYYPASVLERDGAKTFAEGTQSFIDHAEPGKDSAEKLVGVLMESARFVKEDENGKPVLKAPIRFFEKGTYNAEWIKERIGALGLSIRAGVNFENGQRAGRSGRIVTAFTEGISVDIVTRAGAGGKFGTIKESADPGTIDHNAEGGADVPISKEDAEVLAGPLGTAIANALEAKLTPKFDALTTAVTESQKPKVKQFTTSELFEELAKAKLTEVGQKQVLAVHEAKGDVEKAIEDQKTLQQQVAEAAGGKPGGRVDFNPDGTPKSTATEKALPSGWAVASEKE